VSDFASETGDAAKQEELNTALNEFTAGAAAPDNDQDDW
jgi:hypothetical protein